MRARVDGRTVLAGNRCWMEQAGISCEEGPAGGTTVYVAVDGVYAGRLLIEDELKEDAARAVAGLKEARVREIVMLTGDSPGCSGEGGEAGRHRPSVCGASPGDKVEKIEELFREKTPGGQVVFVGDGTTTHRY